MSCRDAWIKRYTSFLVGQCDVRPLSRALKVAQETWDKAQFKFNFDDVCVTDDGFTVIITDMVFEDDTAYYICKPTEFDCSIERSYVAEQLTLKEMVRDKRLQKFWCCDVRKFGNGRIKAIVYSVYAEFLPEDDNPPHKICEQHRYYTITYNEAMQLKRGYDQVDSMVAERQKGDKE